jgi:hypothetical protein
MRERVLHFRIEDEQGKVSSHGGMTVAIVPITDPPDGYRSPMVGIGVAVCHPKDSFTRKRGREIAVGRANVGWFRRPDDPRSVAFYPEELSDPLVDTLLCCSAEAASPTAAQLCCGAGSASWALQRAVWVGSAGEWPFGVVIRKVRGTVLAVIEQLRKEHAA